MGDCEGVSVGEARKVPEGRKAEPLVLVVSKGESLGLPLV